MKIFDIVLKDLRHFFSSVFALVMMFAVPLMIPALIFLAFGNIGSGEIVLPVTPVVVANLDQPQGDWSASQELVNYLQSEEAAAMVSVTLAVDEASALQTVKDGEAAVAVIIPQNFTAASLLPSENAEINLVSEPTLQIGPQVVQSLINGFLDGLSGAKIAVQVATNQFEAQGIALNEADAMGLAGEYVGWIQSSAHSSSDPSAVLPIMIESPQGKPVEKNGTSGMVAPMTAAMIIFFVFFTGANGASMIIYEEEDGTLPRLFTTPTRLGVILGGKSLAVLITLLLQTLVLGLATELIFGIARGQLTTFAMALFGLVVVATGFGLFIMSFIRNSRQAGVVQGGILTIMAMVGGLFTSFIPNMPPVVNIISLVTPQGWAMRAMKLALEGSSPINALVPVAILIGLGCVFFVASVLIFRKRYA